MRLSELVPKIPGARLLAGAASGDDPDISGLAYDSRQVRPGTLFLAVPGEKTDGAEHVPAAAKAGAAAVLSEKERRLSDLPQAVVPDARAAMAAAARAFFGDPAAKMRLAAITGTNGKTTTAYLVRHVLGQAGKKCGMTGTVEYDLGAGAIPARMTTPESLDLYRFYSEMSRAGCGFAVSEVSSHSLVKRRVEGLRFAAAVFTNLTQDHLDFHGSMENYFQAKALLFAGLEESAAAVLNADDPYTARLAGMTGARVVTFGLAGSADVRAQVMSLSTVGTVFKLRAGGFQAEVHLPLLGAHNVHNALAAAAACAELGLDMGRIAEGLATFDGVPGRLESIDCGQDFRVLVDYAHTDDALRSVLNAVRELYPRRIITVFGCGGDRDRGKRPKMGRVVEELSDVAVVTSDNPRSERPEAIIEDILTGLEEPGRAVVVPDRAAAIARAVELARPGDVVLIAGKGHESYQIVGDRRLDFDDRHAARAALERAAK